MTPNANTKSWAWCQISFLLLLKYLMPFLFSMNLVIYSHLISRPQLSNRLNWNPDSIENEARLHHTPDWYSLFECSRCTGAETSGPGKLSWSDAIHLWRMCPKRVDSCSRYWVRSYFFLWVRCKYPYIHLFHLLNLIRTIAARYHNKTIVDIGRVSPMTTPRPPE
jgi:hypothetical protein